VEPPAIPADASRTDTAVSPIIRGESVDIPTPIWGALVEEDLRRIEAGGDYGVADRGADGALLPRPRRLLGWLSVLAAVVTATLHGFAVDAAARYDDGLGTGLAWAAILTSVAAFALGVTAAVLGRGRWLGVVGAIAGVLANPWVVMVGLRLFAG
jgi:hypothetical protein